MVGTVLYPLNELEHVDHDTWLREQAKYEGREHVLQKEVPPLDCLWNDVLHLSPVHPRDIIAGLREAGLEPLRTGFFEIDPFDLDPGRTVVFLNRRASIEGDVDASQWLPFEPAALADLSTFNEASRSYYRACAEGGTRPLLWGYLPHVFYRGSLDTRTLRIIEV
jgi:hypothetical protein